MAVRKFKRCLRNGELGSRGGDTP